MDTPQYLIDKEFKYNNFYDLDYDVFEKDYKYNDVDVKNRIKVFDIEKDEEVVDAIKVRVAECREYIANRIK